MSRMRGPRGGESGETLVEILVSIVIMGLIVGSFFAAIATTALSSTSHRDLVTADGILRASAELTKNSVRINCTDATKTYGVDFSAPSNGLAHVGFTLPANVVNRPCPPVTGSVAAQVPVVTLTVGLPNGITKSLNILVRTAGPA